MTSSLPTGDYTLTYAEKTVEFKVEAAKLTSIKLVNNNLIKDDSTYTASSTAKFSFHTLDQFGNDINVANVSYTTAYGTGTVATTGAAKEVNLTVGSAIIGTTTPVILVDTATGVTLNDALTISAARAAKKATYVGLYDYTNTTELKAVSLSKGDNAATKNAAMLFEVVDQYGDAFTNASANDVNYAFSAGTTGLTKGTLTKVTIANKDYLALPITGSAAAGTAIVNVIQNATGVIGTASFDVSEGTVVKDFTVSVSDTLYATQQTELEYTAVDKNGAAITDVDTLNSLITNNDSARFAKKKDGSVVLNYTPASAGIKVLVFTVNPGTANAFTKTLQVNVSAKRVPTAIIGLDKDVATVVTANNASTLSIKGKDLIIEDQFGNVMDDDLVAASGYNFVTEVKTAGAGVTAISSTALAKDTVVASTTAQATPSAGVVTIKLQDDQGVDIANSTYDVTLQAVDIEKVTDFAFAQIGLVKAGQASNDTIKLTGKYQGATVVLDANEYTQISGSGVLDNGTLTAPIISGTDVKTVSDTVTVLVNNKAMTSVALTYDYSNADAVATKIESKATAATALNKTELAKTITVKDQYGATMTVPNTTRYKVAKITGTGADSAKISYNDTNKLSVTGLANGTYDVDVVYTIGGVTFTQTVAVTLS